MNSTRPDPRSLTRVVTGLLLLVGLVLGPVILAASADATAYRYWQYFQEQGSTWTFAPKGPDQITPADGSVEGWRFAVATEDKTRAPRGTVTFARVCGATAQKSGEKRIAVVIDYGRTADTADGSTPPDPVARCARVPSDATGAQVLAAVAQVRVSKGLVCGIDNEPATTCGEPVKKVSAAAAAPEGQATISLPSAAASEGDVRPIPRPDQDSGNHTGTWVSIAVVVLVVLGVVVLALRRRRSA